ncbi:MAG: hypothetical protein LAP85_15280 [Acidobacteriia bacterium]|nr:hypothetical protein [Terriglobia bacterium]
MKKVEDLTVDELREIVGAVQEILYLDITYSKGPGEDIEMWNQNKEWEIENLEAIAFQLRAHGLEPEEQPEGAEKNDRA